MNKNLRWRLIVIAAVIALAVWSFYPPSQKVNLGLDLKGGVHLVMRVQTDAALRIETETTVERLRERLMRRERPVRQARGDEPYRIRRRRDSERCRVPAGGGRSRYGLRPVARGRPLHVHHAAEHRESAQGGDRRAGAPDDRATRQRAGSGRADRGEAGSRSTRFWCSCPVSPTSRAPRRSSDSTALLELKIVEMGPFPERGRGEAGV